MTLRSSRRRFVAASAAAVTVSAPAVLRAQAPIKWRCQSMWSSAELTYKAFESFCKRVGEATNGRIEVQPFAAGSVTGVFETLDAVSAGVLDAQAAVLIGYVNRYTLVPRDAGFDMPAVLRRLRGLTRTPILTGLPVGHDTPKLTLPHGATVGLATEGRQAWLVMPGH